jgi:creatinine amidohydrolase
LQKDRTPQHFERNLLMNLPFPRREVRWERMFRDELEAAFAEFPVVYFPYGLCEPHGPGIALGVDGLKAHGLSCAAAHMNGGIVAPAWFWHIAEMGGDAIWCRDTIGEVDRSWFTSFPPWMLLKSAVYHARAAEHMGFKGAIFYSGHGGPLIDDFKRVIDLLQPFVGTRLAMVYGKDANPTGFGDGLPDCGHGGKSEMSPLWALEPDCVDWSRLPPAKTGPDFAMGDDIYQSDRRAGEAMVQRVAQGMGRIARGLIDEYDRVKPSHTFIRFEQVEEFWDAQVKPVLPDLNTMQVRFWEDQTDLDPSSYWYPNWLPPERPY